ncbi:acetate/propionate family kinase [Desulforhopalus sp. 52FAK]
MKKSKKPKTKVLVINAGSSSLKYKLFNMRNQSVLCAGIVERIGEAGSIVTHTVIDERGKGKSINISMDFEDHTQAIQLVSGLLTDKESALIEGEDDLYAIGHRVAHGGEILKENCLVDDRILGKINETVPLAPLHNPANIAGIKAALTLFKHVPSIAVFDTQFSNSIPPYAYRYAIPEKFYEEQKVRRYGFHGTSHRYVSRELARLLQKRPEEINNIVCHLGNGSSMTAVKGGVCIDTSMGMTPTAGLIMGTRCGDIDPCLSQYLVEATGKSSKEIYDIFNKDSGLLGICGTGDMRDIHKAIQLGDDKAVLAFEMLSYSIKKYIGAYYAALGRVDAIVFTAGIGENDAALRASCLENLESLGIQLDEKSNLSQGKSARRISHIDSRVQVWVIPTDEEFEIANACCTLIEKRVA